MRELAEEVESTRKKLKLKVFRVKWMGFILLLLVPILSATISVMMDTSWKLFGSSLTAILSYILTLLTILNSIFRPRDRFRKSCSLEMELDNLELKFLIDLEKKKAAEITSDFLLTEAEFFNKSLQPIREAMIDLFLPDSASASDQKDPSKARKTP